jgi:tripeptide aminopeptidase
MTNSNNLVDLFIQLSQIDSESGNETQLANFLINYLKLLGIRCIQYGDMVYARLGTGKPRLFCVHMDTVRPGRGVKVINQNGWIKSDGMTILGADNKAAIAAMLVALGNIDRLRANLEFLFTTREETDGGIKKLEPSILHSKVGYVFDLAGDLNRVVEKTASIVDFKIKVLGKSAHASRPEEGVNAFEVACGVMSSLPIGRIDEETTFNIGVVVGEGTTNTVLANLILEGDLRSSNRATFESMQKRIADAFGNKAEVEWRPYCDGYEISPKSANTNNLADVYRKLGMNLEFVRSTSGSDASWLNNQGIETYCLGDGVLDPHTLTERIKIEDLIRLEEIMETLMVAGS